MSRFAIPSLGYIGLRGTAWGLVLALGGLLIAGPAFAQSPTPATTIQNGNGDTRLQLNYDGGFYVPGTYIGPNDSGAPADSIPETGAGTRLMWYPAKAAFRTGRVSGTQWDASNVGRFSAAFGSNTTAGGGSATAMGTATTASGDNATAMGAATTASGYAATALGNETAAATDNSLSIGICNDANSDPTSPGDTLFAVGNGSPGQFVGCSSRSDALVLNKSGDLKVTGGFILPDGTRIDEGSDLQSLPKKSNGAIEIENDPGFVVTGNPRTVTNPVPPASGPGARLMWDPLAGGAFRAGQVTGGQWDYQSYGNHSTAFGKDTKATIEGSFSAGIRAEAVGSGPDMASVALGRDTRAEGNAAVAAGLGARALAGTAVAIGDNTEANASGAVALGSFTKASAGGAVAMGFKTTAATPQSVTFGEWNQANTTADGHLFVVGNGSDDNNRSDALRLDDAGNLTVNSQNTFSDRRLKTDIRSLGEDVLRRIRDLRPVRYQFKDQQTRPSGEQIGLVAQDVREKFPALVREGTDGMLSLAYPKLTAVLVKGLQEQQTTIDSLRKRVHQVESLRERVAQLEACSPSGSTVAGLPAQGLLAVLLTLGGLGAGLLWRQES
jgi:hypothetical protein